MTDAKTGNMDQAPYYFHQGASEKAYEYLGAHRTGDAVVFRVWAPNAARVRVIGSFNGWSEDSAPALKRISEGGVWEGTVRAAKAGDTYKFLIDTADGRAIYKADPYAFFSETEGGHASVVYDFGKGFDWTDDIRVRIVMLPEAAELKFAMEEMGDFLKKHKR